MNEQDKINQHNIDSDALLCIVKRGETVRIPLSEIIYVESSAHKLLVHTIEHTYEYNDKMNNLAKMLENRGFIRCHQSYLVRTAAVSSVRSDKLTVNGTDIQISRKYKDDVRKILSVDNTSGSNEKAYLTETDNANAGSLICINGPYTGKIFGLVPEQNIMIGRDGDSCDIVINLPRVSRNHFCIIYHEKQKLYEVKDLSTNGTYVNAGVKLQKNVRYEVEPGETIEIGDGTCRFKLL